PGPAHRASARDARRRERRAGRPEPRARARHPGPGGSARSPWPAVLLSMTGTRPRALRGEQVRLRPFRREDLPRVIAWRRHKVLLEVAADNPRAVALYRRAGFETEGVLRRQLVRPDGLVDVIVMAFFFE